MVDVGDGTRRVDADLPQAQLLHLLQHPPLFLIVLCTPPPQLRHNNVPISELLPVHLLLFIRLSPVRIRLYEHIQQRRNRRIGLRRPNRSAT